MVLFPILGAVALGGGTVLERFILRMKKVDIRLYQIASFFTIIIVMLPLLFFFWKVDPLALQLKNLIVFAVVITLAIFANLLFYYSLKGDKVVNLEPARVLEPLFVILLALVLSFFTKDLYERNLKIIIPALISGLALIFSHIKRHHLQFNKYFIASIFGSLFFAIELVLSRLILDFYSPIAFYFIRCFFVFVVSLVFFFPSLSKSDGKTKKEVFFFAFITSIVWIVYRMTIYYGYLKVGVFSTTLIVEMLGPVFVYLFSYLFLKEKITWKSFLTAVIIVASVIYAMV